MLGSGLTQESRCGTPVYKHKCSMPPSLGRCIESKPGTTSISDRAENVRFKNEHFEGNGNFLVVEKIEEQEV